MHAIRRLMVGSSKTSLPLSPFCVLNQIRSKRSAKYRLQLTIVLAVGLLLGLLLYVQRADDDRQEEGIEQHMMSSKKVLPTVNQPKENVSSDGNNCAYKVPTHSDR